MADRSTDPGDLDALDAALGSIVGQGWDDTPPAEPAPTPDTPVHKRGHKRVENPPEPAPTLAEGVVHKLPVAPRPELQPDPVRTYLEPQPHGGGLKRSEYVPVPPDESAQGMMDIGLLADLAAGRKTAEQAARFAGVSVDEIQSSLAVALREVPPEEIAKAMGLQAAEQQLKSGALYGAVLADLVADMAAGRLKPEHKLEMAKLLAKVGRVEPKEDKGVGAGGGFTLNINLGAGERPVVIEAS